MKLRLVVVFATQLLLGNIVAAVDCGSGSVTATLTLVSPDDVTSLASACPTVRASIFISGDIGEDEIKLDGIKTIEGNLVLGNCQAADCGDQKVTKISGSTLELVEGAVDIEGLDSLEQLSLPVLGQVKGTVSIKELKNLKTLELDALGAVGNFSLLDVEQLYYFNLGIAQGEEVSIAGNGYLVLQMGDTDGVDPNLISHLDISGVGELRWGTSGGKIAVGNLSVHDNQVEQLPLLFQSLRALTIWQNRQLTDILFPAAEEAKTELVSQLKQISVTDNEKFNMTTISSTSWNNTDMLTWVWPGENMYTVVLDGIIHNAFFQPLQDAHDWTNLQNANSSKPRVLQDFNITSSVPAFHCEPIDEMRRHGAFPGSYSCNGDKIDIPNNAISSTTRGLYW
ncbi:hypothetical protein SCARD494_01997 [Seiridium cardinale]